ncbi:MAG: sulfate adenylyltransferase subunit CysN [Kiritimatiellaeota bacterium]|nr:sulfate adenylyltransferase subunit CysN [Kiritimatiellota bacterium]
MNEVIYETPDADLARDDLQAYLKRHEEKDLLRCLTCGSVDDGKSTLIGRLLYDTHMIYEDQLAAVTRDSKTHGTTGGGFDPALLTDGLKAEREQGITIDVAYRYFSTARRKFIMADCPGHEQYTRNMATGASTCNLAIILIDARHGVITQTRRHSFICSLLGIRHVLVAVNKMDLVGWSQETFEKIRHDYNGFIARLAFTDIHFIPISARFGDNLAAPSENAPWYNGPTLLHHLETVNIATDRNLIDMRFPVQYVLRPDLDFRGFAGTLASGVVRVGDPVASLPSRHASRVKHIYLNGQPVPEAFAPQALTLTLEDEIDASRGDMFAHPNNLPHVADAFEAMLVWMNPAPAQPGRAYLVKHATRVLPATLTDIRYKMDVHTLRKQPGKPLSLELNEIARVHVTLHRDIAFDPYAKNRGTGAFILIDRLTNETLAAGMIIDRGMGENASDNERLQAQNVSALSPQPLAISPHPSSFILHPSSFNLTPSPSLVTPAQRRALLGHGPATLWLTGLSGSGKSTIARLLEQRLVSTGRLACVLDGDNLRHGLNRGLGFTPEDRAENLRRAAEAAKLLNDAGVIVITAFISPLQSDRDAARAIIAENFFEVFIDTPLAECEARDPKNLYKKARSGEIPNFTGISAPYEPPASPNLRITTTTTSPEAAVDAILRLLAANSVT